LRVTTRSRHVSTIDLADVDTNPIYYFTFDSQDRGKKIRGNFSSVGFFTFYYGTLQTMIDFDYLELMQLKLCMDMTKDKMFMGGDMRRHASITEKVETELRMLDGVRPT